MADRSEYAGLGWRIPPVYFLLALAGTFLLSWLLPVLQLWPGPARWLGVLPVTAGIALAFRSARAFVRAGTTLRPGGGDSTALVEAGPFRYSRNPMYLGLALILLGVALMLGSLTPLLVVPVFMYLIQRSFIRPEEAVLEQTFGDDFRAYCRRVRRWL